ncbi:MAG: hypothetical protein SNF86_06645 [Rikenellaceae bacterium]
MEINLEKMHRRNMPEFWATDTNMRLVSILMSGLEATNEAMDDIRANTEGVAGYSVQRLSLENSLNEQFDPAYKRCIVITNQAAANLFSFTDSETPASELEIFTAEDGESIGVEFYTYEESITTGSSAVGFIVGIPEGVSDVMVRQWVDRVNILGVNYEIIYI